MKTIERTRADVELREAIAALGPDSYLPCSAERGSVLWFSDHPADRLEASYGCAMCPVRLECLAAALERGEEFGVWGGVGFPLPRASAAVINDVENANGK